MNYSFYTPEQTELLNSFKASGKTFVSCAYRNKGTKSPITLMFEAYSMPSPASADSDPNADFQRRMVSKLAVSTISSAKPYWVMLAKTSLTSCLASLAILQIW